VRVCKHVDSYPDYYVHVPCGLEHLGCSGGWESHCKKCKRYFTTDPCGSTDGEDGWSYERRRRARLRAKKVRTLTEEGKP
jgi:hypothetical protein